MKKKSRAIPVLMVQRKRCTGCEALSLITDAKYSCKLFFKINHEVVAEKATKPVPAEPCVKPTSPNALRRAKKKYNAKTK